MTLKHRGIRFRVTAIAVAAMALILVLGGSLLVWFLRTSMTDTIDLALIQRADDLTALIRSGVDLDDGFPAGVQEGFAQLVTADGTVLASTPHVSGSTAVTVELPTGSSDLIRTVNLPRVDDDTFRVLTRALGENAFLHVGSPFEVVPDAAETLVGLLTILLPMLILAFGGVVWWMVGRTLGPVERIRSEVAAIEASELDRRVPEPRTGDEIDRLAGTMNEMLARLQSSAERQRRFIADASHELRSPLTRIRSGLELGGVVELGNGSEGNLLEDVIEMQGLIEDLLYLARADEGDDRLAFQPLDLDDLVIGEARRIQLGGRLEVDMRGVSGAHVVGDRARLRRAIRNLLENAERHARGRVTITLVELGDEAALSVSDDGPGIAASDSERVFERFTRLDESRSSATGGTGLGLAIARQIAQSHGGSLRLTSSNAPGATFEMRLPRNPNGSQAAVSLDPPPSNRKH